MTTRDEQGADTASRARRALLDWLLLVTFLTCACGYVFKAHCMTGGGWTNSNQYVTGCYSDAVPFWTGREVAAGKVPYFQARMEYPVLTGGLIYLEGRATAAIWGQSASATGFLLVVTAVNGVLAMLVTALLWGMELDRSRLWGWALAPPLVLYVGHNWDLLAIALAVGALACARRGRMVRAAALAALGMAAKLFPMFLLPLLALRALFQRRIGAVAAMAGAAIVAWCAVNLPVAAFAFTNWSEFYAFSGQREGTAASLWELISRFPALATTVAERNLWSGLLFIAGAVAIAAFGWRRHRDHLWVLFTPVLAWFLLTNKVYSPQFDLWLYPLMLVTARRFAPVALFLIGDLLAYFAEFWMFAAMAGVWTITGQGFVWVGASVRGAALVWLIVRAVTEDAPPWIHAEPSSEARV
jgi:uncharacterized membrane protein